MIRWLVARSLKLFFRFFYKIEYRSDVDTEFLKKNHFLLIANHVSYYDPPLLAAFWPKELNFLATETLFQGAMAPLVHFLGARSVGRRETLDWAISILRSRENLVIFPEGTRSEDGNLLPFERGCAFIALKAEVDILPVYIDGLSEIWPKGSDRPKLSGNIRLLIGRPIRIEPYLKEGVLSKETQLELVSAMEKALGELAERMR